MMPNPDSKYRPFISPIELPDREWPNRRLAQPPRWVSTDLRDGNQALADPMDGEKKMRFYRMLLEIGFKEIEVAFPSASQTEFNFVRRLIEEELIPDDVTIQVLTQSRADLIARTFESCAVHVRPSFIFIMQPRRCFVVWCSTWKRTRSSIWRSVE